jgi:cytochrome c
MVSMLVLSVGWVPILFIIPSGKADEKALLAELPAPYSSASASRGQAAFKACISCHTLSRTGQKLNGPNLHRIFGRKAGTRENFAYSAAMKQADFTWDAAKLDAWIADPTAFLPGTTMAVPGVADAQTRADLVAFLKVATN